MVTIVLLPCLAVLGMAEHFPAHGKGRINPLVSFACVCSNPQEYFWVPSVRLQAFKIVTGLIRMCWVESIDVSAVELLIGSSCACWGLSLLSDCSLVLISGSCWHSLVAVVLITSLCCA